MCSSAVTSVRASSKILLRITLERIQVKTENGNWRRTGGISTRKGERDQIYMYFVDFKAFDSISHDKLWVSVMDMGYSLHLIDLLAKLYRKQLAKIKVVGTLSECFSVKKGVR